MSESRFPNRNTDGQSSTDLATPNSTAAVAAETGEDRVPPRVEYIQWGGGHLFVEVYALWTRDLVQGQDKEDYTIRGAMMIVLERIGIVERLMEEKGHVFNFGRRINRQKD
ncbi:hypothetical protein FKW77_000872 [Venturia effusa]|uniref:Uncharacterized protein n=1 Tax=Venturia effusa TaxID=50376 RepID=A0A517LGF3_9PEZI|nr:hypothetical protein FKW77_000872 [Venturia effusa]